MSGAPQQNGVAERRNRTLMDMVRSMLANLNISEFLWTETLKMTVHILNRVPSISVPKTPYEIWTGRKPNLRYLRVWGCQVEAKLYNPQSRKLDLKTIGCFFIGHPERSKGYRFYCPSHGTRIVETHHAEFLENANNSGSSSSRRIELQEARDETPIINVPISINTPLDTSNDHLIAQDHPNNVEENEPNPETNSDFDLGKCKDPESFEDAITCDQSAHWREAMEDEMNSMSKNNESINYKETFSLVSRKDSLRIVMALVAHFDFELHQMDVKTAFFNGDLHEDVYMAQPQGFKFKGQEHLVCKLKKSIYELKQASRQWYLKFDEVMKKHNFIKNQVDQCVYLKMSGGNFIILVLYVDDIILASNNIDLLHESKCFLSRNFDMKDLSEASYAIGIEIHRDRANWTLGLSQKAYIERILNRFNMQHCSPTVAHVTKGDVFGSHQCSKTEVEYKEMRRIPYASVVRSLTYAQVCTRPDIAYICGMLGRSDNLEVIGYSDSDFAKCKETSRSTSGYIFMLSAGPISWKSKKQVLTTTSIMMAEYVSTYNATCHAMLLRNLITELKFINSISRPLKIYCDNNAAVSFSNTNSSTRAGLYLDTKYLFICERVEEQRISIEHIRTHEMLADPLTKGLQPKVFQGHVAKMGFCQDLT
ncbi:putative RNA-directed DNA polymerase [Tanacetum coccineum]